MPLDHLEHLYTILWACLGAPVHCRPVGNRATVASEQNMNQELSFVDLDSGTYVMNQNCKMKAGKRLCR